MYFAVQYYCGYNNTVQITCDPAKNAANIERRDLPFNLIADLDRATAVIVEDTRRDYGEPRYRVFGCIGDRLYAAVFTPRNDALHVISLRKANSREVKRHG
jgi:uncharacterized DUF497 family protein